MKNFTWSWDEPEEDARESEPDYPERIEDIYRQAEKEMLHLDAKLDPDGLDKVGQEAWNAYQSGLGYADKDILVEGGNYEEFCEEF